MKLFNNKNFSPSLLLMALCLLISNVALAAKSDMVDYFTDNGFSNAVGPPAGVHHKGVTYVAYQGPKENAWVAAYNHKTGEWTGPFLAGVSAMGKDPTRKPRIDNHGKPSLIIDNNEYIHIAYGGHGGTPALGENTLGNHNYGEQRHIVSKKPLDITSWEHRKNISPFGTYSEWIKMDNGDLYLFYRHGAHRSNWVYQYSTDNGRTFTDPISIALTKRRADGVSQDSWYIYFVKAPNNKVAARVYYHICKDYPNHDGERQNGYYMEMSAKDHVWRNIHGQPVDIPLTKEYADEHILAVTTGNKWVHGGPLALDPQGKPHFLLYLGDNTGHVHGGPKTLHHYRWNGKEWLTQGGAKELFLKRGNLQVSSSNDLGILMMEGTKVAWWKSTDGGKTIKRDSTYFDAKSGNVLISGFIKNAHPDAQVLVARKVSDTDFRRIYLVGDSGAIKRKRSEAELLTEEQKAMPPLKRAKKTK